MSLKEFENAIVASQPANHIHALLEHENVNLMVCAAEPSLIMYALYFGVPALVVAETDEQRAIAKRIEKVGVGAIADEDIFKEQALALIDPESGERHLAK